MMKKLILGIILLCCCAADWPAVDVPPSLRQRNWTGSRRQGSCVHATLVTMLRWHGHLELADWWRRHNGNGEYSTRLNRKMDAAGLYYAYTTRGDVRFLEWAIATRRGAGVTVHGGAHLVMLVHLDSEWACLLDNNNVSKYKWIPREKFLADWRRSSGWAFSLMYAPPPPKELK